MREIPGPNPFEFGIIEKSRKSQTAIRKNPQDEFLKNLEADYKQEKSEKIKMEFFRDIDKKAHEKRIKTQVDNIMESRNVQLYEKRKRLRDLLEREQKAYEDEFITQTLTSNLERASILREKANEIRRKREADHAALVQDKLDQKWRSECDELRTFFSKQLQAGMKDEHIKQIEDKIVLEKKRLEEEAMFADLWYEDIKAKKVREDREKLELHNRNQHVNQVLKQQMKVLDDQKMEEKRQRNENVKNLKDTLFHEKLEKYNQEVEKLQNQATRRKELDLCVKAKKINEDRLAQEEASYDLKMLEEALQSYQNEDMEKFKRKKELYEEQKMYRDYLKNLREEEKLKEKELNEYVNKEIDQQFQKRIQQWRKEKENRKKLLNEVIKERNLQINDKIQRCKEEEEEWHKEREYVQNLAKIYKQEDELARLKHKQKANDYKDDLIQQMNYLEDERDQDRLQDAIDYESNMKNEIAYQNRVIDNKKKILTDLKRY